jgi:hypothetical protein
MGFAWPLMEKTAIAALLTVENAKRRQFAETLFANINTKHVSTAQLIAELVLNVVTESASSLRTVQPAQLIVVELVLSELLLEELLTSPHFNQLLTLLCQLFTPKFWISFNKPQTIWETSFSQSFPLPAFNFK